MNFSEKVCAFTGYRFQKLYEAFGEDGDISKLKCALSGEIEDLISLDFSVFRCGMALGSDMLFAEAVNGFKKKYPKVTLSAFIPCIGQEKSWSQKQREQYYRLLDGAGEVRLISNREYFDGCMQIRNKALVDDCDLLLAVYDGKRGGTMQTVEYAKKNNKQIRIIDPATLLRVRLLERR